MQQRRRDGIPVEDKTWQALLALATEYEVPGNW
jgi:LDH2 family malate/lactate/ureidoglycolate dehydrogenase